MIIFYHGWGNTVKPYLTQLNFTNSDLKHILKQPIKFMTYFHLYYVMYRMHNGWLHKATFQETELVQHRPLKEVKQLSLLSCWGRCWATSPILRGHKGGDEKEAKLPSIVLASRHGKSYFVAAHAGVRRREQRERPRRFNNDIGRELILMADFFPHSVSETDGGCAGTCLQGKHKFQSEWMRSKVTLATGYHCSPTCCYYLLKHIIGVGPRHLGIILPRICWDLVPESDDPGEEQTSQSVWGFKPQSQLLERLSVQTVSGLFLTCAK